MNERGVGDYQIIRTAPVAFICQIARSNEMGSSNPQFAIFGEIANPQQM